MKIETLTEFVAIAKHHSYTKASKELFISQPSLSAHISAMEKELGFSVFERGDNKFCLTAAGFDFLERAQAIIESYNEAVQAGRELSKKQPPIRIYLSEPGSALYKKVITIKSPEICFVDLSYNTTVLNALIEGIIDVGICPTFSTESLSLEEAVLKKIVFEPSGYSNAAIAVSQTHPLAQKKRLTKADCNGLTISISSYAYFDEWKEVIKKMFGKDVYLKFRLNPIESVSELAREDLAHAAHVCGLDSSKHYYRYRDDIVFFEEIEGVELRYPTSIAFRSDCQNTQIHRLVKLLKKSIKEVESQQPTL